MPQSVLQRVASLICLVAFGLGQTVIGPFAVRCEDSSGNARIEIACAKTSDGSCLTLCGSGHGCSMDSAEDEPLGWMSGVHEPHSCIDTPVDEPGNNAKLRPKSDRVDLSQIVALVATLFHPMVLAVVPTTPANGACWTTDQPPDTVARLRTVMLVV